MRRAVLAIVAVVGMVAVAPKASAQSWVVPAIAGHAWLPGEASCFSTPSFSNGVQNSCSGYRSFLIPIVNTQGPDISVQFHASAMGNGSAPNCRYVIRGQDDSSLSLGSSTSVDTTEKYLGSAMLHAKDTVHVDCSFPASPTRKLTSVFFTKG
jgi:hypothetical protein